MTLVSVLIPAYNRQDFIGPAVESVLAQTWRDLEVVVVDDGSMDGTAEVVAGYSDPRVHLIRQQNKGIGAALNTAFRCSRGDYIALLGSDDLYLPDNLSVLAGVLETSPNIGMAYARCQAMTSDGRLLPGTMGVPLKFPGEALRSLIYGDHVCGLAAVVRREFVERAGLWDESLVANEDWDFWIRLAKVCEFAFCDRILAHYRVHAGNISGRASARFCQLNDDRIRVLDKLFLDPSLPPAVAAMRPIAYRDVYTDVGLRWLGAGGWGQAFHWFAKAASIAPSAARAWVRSMALVVVAYLRNWRWGNRLVDLAVGCRRRLRH